MILGDTDDGFNNLQNFPVISTVQGGFPSVTLAGSLNSTPNTVFRLEFFGNAGANSSGFGEGGFFLGSTDVTTDASGDASYDVNNDLCMSQARPRPGHLRLPRQIRRVTPPNSRRRSGPSCSISLRDCRS